MTKARTMGVALAAVVLCVALALLTGCAGPKADGDAKGGASAGKLIVGFDQSYPPYGFVGDDGSYTGFDLDLAKEVAKRNGWEFEASPIDWDSKDAMLNSGTINCIWNGFTMEGREGKYAFSKPYMMNAQVVVVKDGSPVTKLDDLVGTSVLTQADSAAEDVLKKPASEGGKADLTSTFGKLETIGDYNNAFLQLESGAVDAVACDLSIAQYNMAKKPGAYRIIDQYLMSENYAVGFALGNTEMADKVSATLKEMYEDGTAKKICEKYAEYGLSFENWKLK
ncbi:amino acid ABC transporter substrate-binding protein [Eggerthellaceae bacterium zg-997]|nr:amino acid ABC transporter substrate-binding protein [Eggerthellaceae bacterium zg-997]